MLIPAGIALENSQVNLFLPLIYLVGGVILSTALWKKQNKLPGTTREESLVHTNQGFYSGTAKFYRDHILTSCNPMKQLRPIRPTAASASILPFTIVVEVSPSYAKNDFTGS